MYKFLRVEGDPSIWSLATPVDSAQLTGSAGPLTLAVERPLAGTMLLSGRAAAAVAFLDPPPAGWHPSGVTLFAPVLYLPTATGPTASSPGYQLPGGTDLAGLQDQVTASMQAGQISSVEVGGGAWSGTLVLNGGMLSYVVLGRPVQAG
jgi:hypothetical protein